MASWNSQVRGNVIAIKTHCGWDPTQIVDATNPMPSESNMNGFGQPTDPGPDQSQMSVPGMDPYTLPTVKHGNPNAGKSGGGY